MMKKICSCALCNTVTESNPSDKYGLDPAGKPYYLCKKCYESDEFRNSSKTAKLKMSFLIMFNEYLDKLKEKRR
jgi:transposase-like protein